MASKAFSGDYSVVLAEISSDIVTVKFAGEGAKHQIEVISVKSGDKDKPEKSRMQLQEALSRLSEEEIRNLLDLVEVTCVHEVRRSAESVANLTDTCKSISVLPRLPQRLSVLRCLSRATRFPSRKYYRASPPCGSRHLQYVSAPEPRKR